MQSLNYFKEKKHRQPIKIHQNRHMATLWRWWQFLSTLEEREKQIERDALYTIYKNVGRGYNAIQMDLYNLTLNTFSLIWFDLIFVFVLLPLVIAGFLPSSAKKSSSEHICDASFFVKCRLKGVREVFPSKATFVLRHKRGFSSLVLERLRHHLHIAAKHLQIGCNKLIKQHSAPSK